MAARYPPWRGYRAAWREGLPLPARRQLLQWRRPRVSPSFERFRSEGEQSENRKQVYDFHGSPSFPWVAGYSPRRALFQVTIRAVHRRFRGDYLDLAGAKPRCCLPQCARSHPAHRRHHRASHLAVAGSCGLNRQLGFVSNEVFAGVLAGFFFPQPPGGDASAALKNTHPKGSVCTVRHPLLSSPHPRPHYRPGGRDAVAGVVAGGSGLERKLPIWSLLPIGGRDDSIQSR